jgi:hypothetical protein
VASKESSFVRVQTWNHQPTKGCFVLKAFVQTMTDIIKSIIEPTYRTEPEESGKLYPSQAKIIAERILQEKLDGKSSDDIEFAFEELSARITEDVRDCVKSSMNVGRYKVLVQATIGTMKDQGVKITSR